MQNRMVRFLNSIGISDPDRFDLDFDSVQRNPFDRDLIEMQVVKDKPWDYSLLREFQDGLSMIKYPYNLTFSYRNRPNVYDAINLFRDWYRSIYFTESPLDIEAERATISFLADEETLSKYNFVIEDFKSFLRWLGYEFLITTRIVALKVEEPKVVVSERKMKSLEKKADNVANISIEESKEEKEKSYEENAEESQSQDNKESEVSKYEEGLIQLMEENLRQMQEDRKRRRQYKKGDYVPLDSIKEIPQAMEEDQNVDFSGVIFEVDVRKSRKNDNIYGIFGIGDDSGAIYIRATQSGKIMDADKINGVKIGQYYRVRGYPSRDRNNNDITITVHFLDLLPPPPPRVDNHETKRVELHAHTKFSAFDGLASIMDYAKAAKEMGHTAIAVTDHGVAQAYPEAQAAEKKTGVRMIYGSELYMVDNVLECALNPKHIKLDNATYVVFDFETTGLSSRYDQIIEFGACRYEKGMMVKSIDLFVKPKIKLSKKIIELTGITQEMADKGVSIKEAIQIMEDFCRDAILVTHNAKFDIGFMNQARINNGLPPIDNPAIDTLALSRYLFPTSRRHNLGALAKNMEITSYNEDEAHRADFDAKVLAEVWLAILSQLTKTNQDLMHDDLTKFEFSKELLVHYRPSHVTALCKDPDGLKDLYKLISESHIEYFANVPKLPRSDISRFRDHLLLGSACQNGEIWDIARTKTEEELVEAMKFYDYIEIQPPECYSNLIGQEEMTSEEITRTILDIIKAAKIANKLICVTGDAHYVSPSDKKYRDVYIDTPKIVIGGGNHPLNPFSRTKLPPYENPNQHYRTTQEMFDQFPFLSDEEKEEYIVTNTNIIANMCSPLQPVKDHLYKPTRPHCEEDLRDIVFSKAKLLYGDPIPELIVDRLEKELHGICDNGYAVTYTIARDIILQANKEGFIVGSRGSVGSSFVATMADITEINPLPPHYRCPKCKHFELSEDSSITSGYDLPEKVCPICGEKMIHDGQNIPFETFLGFNADKVPDIDLNFPPDYQAKAHDFTKVLFGENNVFRAGTIGTVADKTAYGYVRKYFESKGLDPNSVPRAEIAYLASHCTEVKRTTGQHPGGIVVVPKEYDVYDFCPIQYPADELDATWKTTHFEFAAIHDTLLKLDLLGHDDPMAIKMMCEEIGIFYKDIPLNDKKVISLFSSDSALGRKRNYLNFSNGALGLPEFGTNFVRGMLDATKPKSFAELVILSGLSHGTDVWQGNAELLIKDNICTLREVIGCRDDIMIYLISKGVPNKIAFSTMEDVRKAKKVKPEYAEVLTAKGVPAYYIDSCNKIKYLFPKAHACAYVSNALRVAYFKVYYPLVYYAIYFTIRCDKFDIKTMAKGEEAIIAKIDELKRKKQNTENHSIVDDDEKFTDKDQDVLDTLTVSLEMYERGYKIENINLYKSEAMKFIVNNDNNSIIPPFNVVDGLGQAAAQSVVESRQNGEFTSKEDLLRRTKLSQSHVKLLDELKVLGDMLDSDQLSLFDFGF